MMAKSELASVSPEGSQSASNDGKTPSPSWEPQWMSDDGKKPRLLPGAPGCFAQ